MFRSIWTFSVVLLLAACGGGGGGGGGSAPLPTQPQTFELTQENVTSTAPQPLLDAAQVASQAQPAFGSVTQSSNVDGTRVTTDRARVTFDGSTAEAEIGTHQLTVLQAHPVIPSPVRSGYEHQQAVAGSRQGDSAKLAVLGLDWNPNDATDYIGFGYWLGVDGVFDDAPRAEIGAFIDGPELRGTPVVPVIGSATYRGKAQGFYGAVYGSGASVPSGTLALGEFTADASLTADFEQATIGGRIYSVDLVEAGITPTGQTYTDTDESAYELILGTTSIGNGMFTGTTQLRNSELPITSSSGRWGGRFSNQADSDGEPRLVGGTFGASATLSGGTTGEVIGVFGATKQ